MIRSAMAKVDVKVGIESTLKKIRIACSQTEGKSPKPLLVAVSKTKPAEMIIEAYLTGQRHFGENYVQELIEKGNSALLLENCPDIKWHYIGHLQTNKINKKKRYFQVLKTPGLYMIQTVDSEKLANTLNSAWQKIHVPNKEKLRVLVQVNTSREEEKNGIEPENALKLFKHIQANLPFLKVEGVMTIGKFGHDYSTGPNPDFISLMNCKKEICETLKLNPADVQVSMGMSDDFQNAIKMGSTIVRVGSSIFGIRPVKKNSTSALVL